MKRTIENTVQMGVRVSKDRMAAFNAAHARLKEPRAKAVLMDRAIDLLIADLKDKKELARG